MRQIYVSTAHRVRGFAKGIGLLDVAERSKNRKVFWLRSLLSIYDSADMAKLDVPWWAFSAIDFVEARIKERKGRLRVFEYGSGASTIWLARRCTEVITVEHDIGFTEVMRPLFSKYPNIRLEIHPPEVPTRLKFSGSRRKGYTNYSFDRYVESIDAHSGDFDMIIIDGRSRIHCLEKAKDRLDENGFIIFDNSDRIEYREAINTSHLDEHIMRGLTPALPFPGQTSILYKSKK